MSKKSYGTEITLEELKGHYEKHFLKAELFIELVELWCESEVKNLTMPDVIKAKQTVCSHEYKTECSGFKHTCKKCGHSWGAC